MNEKGVVFERRVRLARGATYVAGFEYFLAMAGGLEVLMIPSAACILAGLVVTALSYLDQALYMLKD